VVALVSLVRRMAAAAVARVRAARAARVLPQISTAALAAQVALPLQAVAAAEALVVLWGLVPLAAIQLAPMAAAVAAAMEAALLGKRKSVAPRSGAAVATIRPAPVVALVATIRMDRMAATAAAAVVDLLASAQAAVLVPAPTAAPGRWVAILQQELAPAAVEAVVAVEPDLFPVQLAARHLDMVAAVAVVDAAVLATMEAPAAMPSKASSGSLGLR
jgi:hypothetical protein